MSIPDQRPSPLGSAFWKLWGSVAVTNLGDAAMYTGAALLAASLSRDPAQVAGVALASSLPWLLFSLPTGALVDRLDRKRLLYSMNTIRALVMVGTGIAIFLGWMNLWLLYTAAFLMGTAEVFYDNAAQSALPSVVRKENLVLANSRLQLAEIVGGGFVGPPLGSLLFTLAAALPFGLHGAGLLVSAVLIFSIRGSFRSERPEPDRRTSLAADILEGVRWLFRHRLLRTLAVMIALINLFNMATGAIFVLFALEVMQLGEAKFGVLLVAGAVGGLLGALLADRVAAWLGHGQALLWVVLVQAGCYAMIALFPNPWAVGILLALESMSGVVWNVVTVSLRQSLVPNHLLGRVNSAYRMLAWGVNPLGAALGGILGKTLGLSSPFWLGAFAMAGMALLMIPFVNNRTIQQARDETSGD